MPDDLTPLFADLRRQALPRVRPPGADAARRTVHRRATVQAATAAAALLAAGGSFLYAQRPGTDGTVTPAAPPSASTMAFVSGEPIPESSGAVRRGLPNKARIAGGLVPGADHAGVVSDFAEDVGMAAEAGRHRLRVGCSGPAPLPVTILVDNDIEQQHTLSCADSGVVEEYEFTLAEAGSVRVLIGSGGQFDAYALKLTKIRG